MALKEDRDAAASEVVVPRNGRATPGRLRHTFFRPLWRPHRNFAGSADGPTQYLTGERGGEHQQHIRRAEVGQSAIRRKESPPKIPRPWIGLLIAGSFSLGSVAWADEKEKGERVTIDPLPAAAKATIQKETQGAEIKELKKETEGGKVVYSAEIVKDGKESEVHVAADGTVTKRGAEEEEDEDED